MIRRIRATSFIVSGFILSYCQLGHAEDGTSGWWGVKSKLAEHGIEVESVLTVDLLRNVSGGVKRGGNLLGNYDLTVAVDTGKAGLWENGEFFFYGLGNFGKEISDNIGDRQVTSNIETYSTAKLYEAWYQHHFFDDSLAVLAGLHDYNSEFETVAYGGTLINSSFGISPDISQVGPSIFSTTAPAVRIRVVPTEHCYVLGAIYDGVPGDPNDPQGTQIALRSGDGAFYGFEVGRAGEEGSADYWKAAVGGWYHTTNYEDFVGNERSSNGGIYAVGEYTLYSEGEGDSFQGLGAFLQLGSARESRNELGAYVGAGLSYTGLIPGRDADIVALGVAHARLSDDFRETDSEFSSAETAIELNYRLALGESFAITPDLQFVHNPSGRKDIDNAWQFGARIEWAM